jgi:hypothetical protein
VGCVPRAWYFCWVKNRYSFTVEGLQNIAVYDVTPQEVWEVLHAARRLTRQLASEAVGIFGVTARGRYLVVFVIESRLEDNDWDIWAAREMDAEEIATFDRQTGRQP